MNQPIKTSTEYTAPTLIVVKPSARQLAENAAVAADPEGGAGTFVPGTSLRVKGDQSSAVAAYWARWNMKPSQRSVFATQMGGPNNIIAPGGNVPLNRDRWFFDAADGAWTGQQVLDALNLEPIPLADNW